MHVLVGRGILERQPPGNGLQFGVGLFHRYPREESAECAVPRAATTGNFRGSDRERHPQVVVVRKPKTFGHHADDGALCSTGADGASDHARVVVESILPDVVTQDHHGRRVWVGVVRRI